jgi:hypothetical protein
LRRRARRNQAADVDAAALTRAMLAMMTVLAKSHEK